MPRVVTFRSGCIQGLCYMVWVPFISISVELPFLQKWSLTGLGASSVVELSGQHELTMGEAWPPSESHTCPVF